MDESRSPVPEYLNRGLAEIHKIYDDDNCDSRDNDIDGCNEE